MPLNLSTTVRRLKSRATSLAFVFSAVALSQLVTAGAPVKGLHVERFLPSGGGPAAVGVALATGPGGELYALYDAPPRLVVWKTDSDETFETGDVSGWVSAPTDLVSDGGMQLLVTDSRRKYILRLNHRLQPMPPVMPEVDGERFEPLSICRITDGTLFVINRADDDVWRINRDGRAVPLGWSPARSGKIRKPTRLDYSVSVDRLIILDEDGVKLSAPHGDPGPPVKTVVARPVGAGVNGDEAWIVGDGLCCVSLDGKPLFSVPVDSLESWGVYPAVDVAPQGDRRLYLLPETGGRVLVLRVERAIAGRP